jgi:hypothetical protein
MQKNIGLHSFSGLLVDYIAAPVSSNTSERPMVTLPVDYPYCLGTYQGTLWMHVTMV